MRTAPATALWGVLWMSLLSLAPPPTAAQPAGSPASLHAALARVDTLRTHGDFRPALARLDSLRHRHPRQVEVLWRRALLISDIGRRSEDEDTTLTLHRRALRVADTARTVAPTSPRAHLVTALASGRLTLHVGPSARVRRSRAVKRHADRALALDSTLAGAYHLRGRWHRQVADMGVFVRTLVRTFYGGLPDASFEQAVDDFRRAITLESKPYNHLELGKTYLAMDRDAAARRQLRRALETSGSPFDAEHWREARSLLRSME